MLDYAKWLERALAFPDRLRAMPDAAEYPHNDGRVAGNEQPGAYGVQKAVAPPLTDKKIRALEKKCRLPIPAPLKRFWKEASGHLKCLFWWNVPAAFHQQIKVALPNWDSPYVSGGPEFLSPSDIVTLPDSFLDWAASFAKEFPKDARFWEHSLPILPLGNGDHIAFYLRDKSDNPPLAYLCHEGYGASHIIAASFDGFIAAWEELGYLNLDDLHHFYNEEEMIDPMACPVEVDVLRSLWDGEERHVVKASQQMTESSWSSCMKPESLFRWLQDEGLLEERNLREFNNACCRRVWDRLGPLSRKAVIVSEEYLIGKAGPKEMEAARSALLGGENGKMPFDNLFGNLQEVGITNLFEMLTSDSEKLLQDEKLRSQVLDWHNNMREITSSMEVMYDAALEALDSKTTAVGVLWQINQHLDEPELSAERAAQIELIRKIFGNPFEAHSKQAMT
jgi:SMI1 / KNR4 family (SUKH-1)